MFTVSMSPNEQWFVRLTLAGCPEDGVAAVDFRRKHGLPLEPTSCITLPCPSFVDEEVARSLPLNKDADFYLWDVELPVWYGPEHKVGNTSSFEVDPDLLARFLFKPSAIGIAELYLDIKQRAESRRQQEVQEESDRKAADLAKKEAHRKSLEDARVLMADEIREGEDAKKLLKKTAADRDILADFLSSIPEDALTGTLRSLTSAAGEDAMEELRVRVEDASPRITIFAKDDVEA